MEINGNAKGVFAKKYEEQCISRDNIGRIRLQPGCALQVIMPGRGDEEKRKTVLAWVVGNYPHHILVRVDTSKGPYNMSLNKVDIAKGEVVIREVV